LSPVEILSRAGGIVFSNTRVAKQIGKGASRVTLDAVRLLFRTTGLILLTAFWLPLGLFGFRQADCVDGGPTAKSLGFVCAAQAPHDGVQFLESRVSALQCWCAKRCGCPGAEATILSATSANGSVTTWPVVRAPDELFQRWQFYQRAALQQLWKVDRRQLTGCDIVANRLNESDLLQ